MIYVEFISRRPGIEIADFHRVVRQVQQNWEAASPRDELILNAGRTWRLGSQPEYLGIWHSPGVGLERLGEWEQAFRMRGEVGDEATMSRVARVDVAGCYEALLEPRRARDGLYYIERFRCTGPSSSVRSFYEHRGARLPRFVLNLLALRIGRLAPDPGGLAVWTVPGYGSLGEIAGEADKLNPAMEWVEAGLYADIGSEIL
jgi:hypothetical protein